MHRRLGVRYWKNQRQTQKTKKGENRRKREKGKNTAGTQWLFAAARLLFGALNIYQVHRNITDTEATVKSAAIAQQTMALANNEADEQAQHLQRQVCILVEAAKSLALQWQKECNLFERAAVKARETAAIGSVPAGTADASTATYYDALAVEASTAKGMADDMLRDAERLFTIIGVPCPAPEGMAGAIEKARLHVDAYASVKQAAAGRKGAATNARDALHAANGDPGPSSLEAQRPNDGDMAAATEPEENTSLPKKKELAALASKSAQTVAELQIHEHEKIVNALNLAKAMQANVLVFKEHGQAVDGQVNAAKYIQYSDSTSFSPLADTINLGTLVSNVTTDAENAEKTRSEALQLTETALAFLKKDLPDHFNTVWPGLVLAIGSLVVRAIRQGNPEGLSIDGTSRALLALSASADLMHITEFAFNPNRPAGRYMKEKVEAFEREHIAEPDLDSAFRSTSSAGEQFTKNFRHPTHCLSAESVWWSWQYHLRGRQHVSSYSSGSSR